MSDFDELDRRCVTALRFLAVDAVEAARSGHPGLPLGAAPMAYALWTRHLRHSPANPSFFDRDRFVLSAGHGSALLYALLHLTGYALSLDELRRFRQWGSLTPGHPERGLTPGVEASTGPLGQGLSNAVGMAIAATHMERVFRRDGEPPLLQHAVYVLASDGDLMEGVTSEASALAGHLGLGRLVVLYDDNRVTLSGAARLASSEDVRARYAAYGWHVQRVDDGNDLDAISDAITRAKAETERPSFIEVRTTLGYGAPDVAGTFHAHGNPLGPEETRKTKLALGWPVTPAFLVPDDVQARFRTALQRGQQLERDFDARLAALEPTSAEELRRRIEGRLPDGWRDALPRFAPDARGLATRDASQQVLHAIAPLMPELIGGSGDLDPSTKTVLGGLGDFERDEPDPGSVGGRAGGGWGRAGRNVHFGIREHAMGAIVNGLALHGGVVPFGATFLVFSDYMRPPIRLAALARSGSIFVFTHDSIALGEDGPSHQPVEHLAALRAIPELRVIRPADANETVVAWEIALATRDRPTALVLTRQAVPTLDRAQLAPADGLRRGAYVLADDAGAAPDVVLIATGSEVAIALGARARLATSGVRARVVSMPCWELFEEETAAYRDEVLPPAVRARVAIEAASSLGWERWTEARNSFVGVDRFGASAPGEVVMEAYGMTVQHVVERALATIARGARP